MFVRNANQNVSSARLFFLSFDEAKQEICVHLKLVIIVVHIKVDACVQVPSYLSH